MRFKFNRYALWLTLLTGLTLTGCYKEDEADCVDPVETVDALEIEFRYPRGGTDMFGTEVESVSLFVFDENEKYVGRWDEYDTGDLTNGYTMRVELAPGRYHCVAWGGLHAGHFDIKERTTGGVANPVEGTTTLDELMMHITHQETEYISSPSKVVSHKPCDLFYGNEMEIDVEGGTDQPQRVVIDLKKYSTQIRLILKGLPLPGITRADHPFTHLLFHLEAPNGEYDFLDNQHADNTFTYTSHFVQVNEDNTLIKDFHTLKMQFGSRHTFTIYDTEKGEPFFSADLLEDYIRKDPQNRYQTQQQVDEEDYFELELDFDTDGSTSLGVTVTINGYVIEETDHEIQ